MHFYTNEGRFPWMKLGGDLGHRFGTQDDYFMEHSQFKNKQPYLKSFQHATMDDIHASNKSITQAFIYNTRNSHKVEVRKRRWRVKALRLSCIAFDVSLQLCTGVLPKISPSSIPIIYVKYYVKSTRGHKYSTSSCRYIIYDFFLCISFH